MARSDTRHPSELWTTSRTLGLGRGGRLCGDQPAVVAVVAPSLRTTTPWPGRRGPDGGSLGHVSERPIRSVLTREQFNEMLRDAPPPTADDVSVTRDGRRLDSAEAVIEFFTALEAELAADH